MNFKQFIESEWKQGELDWDKPQENLVSAEDIKKLYKDYDARSFVLKVRQLGFDIIQSGKERVLKQVLELIRKRDYQANLERSYKLSQDAVAHKPFSSMLKQGEVDITPNGWINTNYWVAKLSDKMLAKSQGYVNKTSPDRKDRLDPMIDRIIQEALPGLGDNPARLRGARTNEFDSQDYVFDDGETQIIVDARKYASYKKIIPDSQDYISKNEYGTKSIVSFLDTQPVGMIMGNKDDEVDYKRFN